MLPIGYNNFVSSKHIVAILPPDAAQVKKLRRDASEFGMLINATDGLKAKSVIVLRSNHIVLSALQPETLKARLKGLM
jgi:regulator of extracellular matrix RemA (YlzA/DUF370 family)